MNVVFILVCLSQRSDDVLAAIDHLLSAPPEILEESQQQFNTSTLYVCESSIMYCRIKPQITQDIGGVERGD